MLSAWDGHQHQPLMRSKKPELLFWPKRVTTEEIALHLGVSQGTAYSLVLDIFGLCKVYVRWVFKTAD
jgi:fibrillarin-like rRNA methylase